MKMNQEAFNLTRALRNRLLPMEEEELSGPMGRRRQPKFFKTEDVDDIERFIVALMGEDFQATPGTLMYEHIQGRGYPTMVRRSAYYIASFHRTQEEEEWRPVVASLQASLAKRPAGFDASKEEAARALLPIARRLSRALYFSTGKTRREDRSLLREATDEEFEEEVLPALETFLTELEPELPHVLEHLYKVLLEMETEFYEEEAEHRDQRDFEFVRDMRY